MPEIVGVRFKPVTKIYYFDPNNISELDSDSWVIVETSRGIEMGMVAQPVHQVPADDIKGKLKKVIRKATPLDLVEAQKYIARESEVLDTCKQISAELDVPIKVLGVEYSFDGTRLVVSFSAEQRVDFRDLARQMARVLETRIEMKQVGARDETKLLDGYGRCGRQLCCSSWLTEFHPVSIRMAKNQSLPLAPAEISGLCGRLLCCLAYENEQYVEIRKNLPEVGSTVKLSKEHQEAVGMVRGMNVIKETILVETNEGDPFVEVLAQDVEVLEKAAKGKKRKR